MNKKKLFLIGAIAAIVAIIAIAAGLTYYFYFADKTPPPARYAFASDRSGAGDIFVLDSTGQLVNLTNHPEADWAPVWAVDGAKLAFTSHRSGNSDVWVLDMTRPPAEGEPRNLTNDPAWDYSPTWSPSCQSVAFVSERDGDPEIFVQNLETETALQLTFNSELDRLPTWSPDGKLIAFAGVRDGMEQIRLIRPDGTDEQVATPPTLQGTAPAWSPDSQRLAFIGWNAENQAGIYLVGPGIENIEQIYQGQGWLGSLGWSADGRWLTFTAWQNGNHDVFALSITGGEPIRLTTDPAWDDFLALNPKTEFVPTPPDNVAQAAPAPTSPESSLQLGLNLADLGMTYLINDLGFGWGKSYVNWATVEPQPGEFRWVDPDNVVKAMSRPNTKILMRVHGTPDWARPAGSSFTHPPTNVADFANFMTQLATRYKGQVAAYEIWNEPNLNYEWGEQAPDPAAYTELLKAAYTAVKAVDPAAKIISGGLATTGDGSATAYGDLDFLRGMYEAGAAGYFDALGSHPYPFGHAPDEIDPWGLSLSRVEAQHQVMAEQGDGDTPIWITEVGWAIHSNWDLGGHAATTVTQAQQAQYLVETITQTPQKWPFVEAIFIFNLDFSTVSWYPSAEPMRWYSILNPDRTPRPAYTNLRQETRP